MISIDQIFNNQYYKKSNWIYLLIPFSIIFYCISISKNYLYKNGFLKRIKIKVPVLIIGNITLGGTGKTPLALNLITKFLNEGLNPALISRGYGGSAKNITEVHESSNARSVGDEALLIKAKSKIMIGNIWNFLLLTNSSKISLTVDNLDIILFLEKPN